MRLTTAVAMFVRLLVLAVPSWFLVAVASPTPDPFVVNAGWLLVVVVVLAVPSSRGFVARWVRTGRLRRTAA